MSEKNNDDVSDDSLLDDSVKDLDDENEYSDDRDQLIEKLNLDLSASEEKYLRLAAEMENPR